jgi:transcriptional regulator with XRE-family HTH domain
MRRAKMKQGRLPEDHEGFREEEEALIEYLCLPENERGTQKELAKELDITQKTLTQWKKKPEIKQAVMERKLEVTKYNTLPEVISVIENKIKDEETAEKYRLEYIKEYRTWLKEIIDRGNFGEIETGNAVQVNINSSIPRSSEEVVDVGGDT